MMAGVRDACCAYAGTSIKETAASITALIGIRSCHACMVRLPWSASADTSSEALMKDTVTGCHGTTCSALWVKRPGSSDSSATPTAAAAAWTSKLTCAAMQQISISYCITLYHIIVTWTSKLTCTVTPTGVGLCKTQCLLLLRQPTWPAPNHMSQHSAAASAGPYVNMLCRLLSPCSLMRTPRRFRSSAAGVLFYQDGSICRSIWS